MTSAIYMLLMMVIFAKAFDYDDIDLSANSGTVLKILRDMSNQTKEDTLNLPANATSIRQNIVDTFSCENRTYGYYADVDNECQIFHVCLQSQSSSGRNATYRWSFICPNETIFNQQVLVCTRPRDSIDCEDSPMYYDVNMEFGKTGNESKEEKDKTTTESNDKDNTETVNGTTTARYFYLKPQKNHKRKQSADKENIVERIKEITRAMVLPNEDGSLVVEEVLEAESENNDGNDRNSIRSQEELDNSRIVSERSFRTGRKIDRGSFKFKADYF